MFFTWRDIDEFAHERWCETNNTCNLIQFYHLHFQFKLQTIEARLRSSFLSFLDRHFTHETHQLLKQEFLISYDVLSTHLEFLNKQLHFDTYRSLDWQFGCGIRRKRFSIRVTHTIVHYLNFYGILFKYYGIMKR